MPFSKANSSNPDVVVDTETLDPFLLFSSVVTVFEEESKQGCFPLADFLALAILSINCKFSRVKRALFAGGGTLLTRASSCLFREEPENLRDGAGAGVAPPALPRPFADCSRAWSLGLCLKVPILRY
jgi:hypothetical protein